VTQSLLEALKPIIPALSKAIGPNSEVVLHDLSQLESSVIAISGDITNRSVGDSITDLGLNILQEGEVNNELNYRTHSSEGKTLRSSTLVLRDSEKNPIGLLCINIDITYWQRFLNKLSDYCETNELGEHGHREPETFTQDVNQLLKKKVDEAIRSVEPPPSDMSKEERFEVVKELNEQGVFLIRNSMDYLAGRLNVSRNTIYNYLNELEIEREFENLQ